jgi:polysaccharide biosynthesis/export protein
MADDSSERTLHVVHRLFNFGAIGTLSDAELLERFASRDDESADAAFEELVIRHGRMVLLVCRRVLPDSHDAEDAFQATFLVLANRARSIRRGGSVASWLFGVALRAAKRVKRAAMRRQRLNERLAEQTPRSEVSADTGPDWEVLHREIDGLPERFRTPVVLCYFEGQTTGAAALALGIPEATVRGRLARARERLRRRLIGRGLATIAAAISSPVCRVRPRS